MKNRIAQTYPESCFTHSQSVTIYIADFSRRTKKDRGVEVHDSLPKAPGSEREMDCLQLNNRQAIPIEFNIFDDNQFKDADNKDMPHCECCFFPQQNTESTWIGFVEIKDCETKNILQYKGKMKVQLRTTIQQFREKHIISNHKVYGIISFPRKKKVAFNQTLFEDITELKQIWDAEKILFIASNEINIESPYRLAEP